MFCLRGSCASVLYTTVRMGPAKRIGAMRAGHGFRMPYKGEFHFSDFFSLRMKPCPRLESLFSHLLAYLSRNTRKERSMLAHQPSETYFFGDFVKAPKIKPLLLWAKIRKIQKVSSLGDSLLQHLNCQLIAKNFFREVCHGMVQYLLMW